MTKQQRGEFEATVQVKQYPSSPRPYWLGQVKRPGQPTIYTCCYPQESKTLEEFFKQLKEGREASYKENSDIEKREHRARVAEAQLSYYENRYGEDSSKRPTYID